MTVLIRTRKNPPQIHRQTYMAPATCFLAKTPKTYIRKRQLLINGAGETGNLCVER